MNFYDAVREVSIRTGISETEACEKIGKKKSYISSARLRGSVPQIDNASMIVDAFGWELVAIPKGSVLDDAIPITSERKQGSDDDNRRQIAAMQRKLESLQRQSEELQKRLVDMG